MTNPLIPSDSPSHFQGKDAIEHVIEAQTQGILASAEFHGAETSGKVSAAADALRDCTITLLLTWHLLTEQITDPIFILSALTILGLCLVLWKAGRSAWLGWSRLERLHRVLTQEKWEIEHHRQQERDELRVLYAAKGFEGKLLEDVLDVLMADGDRLLKVMVEEELGLSLESHEHPLMQSLGAAMGAIFASAALLLGLFLQPHYGPIAAAAICIGIGGALSASYAQNRLIPAIIWNLGILSLSYGTMYFLTAYYNQL